MSTVHGDISANLLKGMFTVLDSYITVDGINYDVFKSIPKTPPDTYVFIGNVVHDTEGTKDNFQYNGTVQVQIIDQSQYRADMKLAKSILNVTRGLLKSSKAGVFSISPSTLIVFAPGTYNELAEMSDDNISRVKLIDQYEFVIE